MSFGRLAALAVIAAAGGAAWGQAPQPDYPRPLPNYDEALAAVTEAGCERKETANHIRFVCEEGEAVWYFTRGDRQEHPGYRVLPAYRMVPNGGVASNLRRIDGFGRFESARERDAYVAWMRVVLKDWSENAPRRFDKPKRDPRGKLYPLEP
jgi:hypothetical protein